MRQNIRSHALRTTILAGRRDVHIEADIACQAVPYANYSALREKGSALRLLSLRRG